MRNKLIFIGSLFASCTTFCQEQAIFVNLGTLSVGQQSTLSSLYDFSNKEQAVVKNDGKTIYYSDFNNDNLYYHSTGKTNALAVFNPVNQGQKQIISGLGTTDFYDVVFQGESPESSFELQSEWRVFNSVDFQNGIVRVDSLKGMLTLENSAVVKTVHDKGHVQGFVEKIGNQDFSFPTGDKGNYRGASISSPLSKTDIYQSKYILDDKAFFLENNQLSGVINTLNDTEYWIVEASNKNSKQGVVLTLSWSDSTTAQPILQDNLEDLHVVKWDQKQKLWVDQGGIVDLQNKTVTIPTSIQDFGVFTLATVKKQWLLEGDVVIYNFVSTHADGKNDYFKIDNIQRFENNSVEIFNRWGTKVYSTTNYDSNSNVFNGYSNTGGKLGSVQKLPSGTYYYILNYEYKDKTGSRPVKKAGYLHLESN
ncbi:gliding motility-associated C-terminal domain-containing protein [Myroides sp. LJL110]